MGGEMELGGKAAGRLTSVGGPPPSPLTRITPPWLVHPTHTATAQPTQPPATLISGYLLRGRDDSSLVHYIDFVDGWGTDEEGAPKRGGRAKALPIPLKGG